MSQSPQPKIGIGVMILKGDQVLLGKRKGSHAAGEYAFPGGHLEYMESFESCARREAREECGIKIGNIRFQYLANVKIYAGKHYVHIGLLADWTGGEPQLLEPDKCEGWAWYPLNALPKPLMELSALGIDSYRTQKNYYDP